MGLIASYTSSMTVYKYPLNSIALHVNNILKMFQSEILNASTNLTPDTRGE